MVVEQQKAKEEKEKLEQRMVERDQQWKRQFDEVIAKEKDAWKTAMEDHDRKWQACFDLTTADAECMLQEQAEQQECYHTEVEQKMKQMKEGDSKRMEEHLEETKVRCVMVDWHSH